MNLYKVTYEKLCHPNEGIFLKQYKGYYMSDSLDRLYDYIENEKHLTVKKIEILQHETVFSETIPT